MYVNSLKHKNAERRKAAMVASWTNQFSFRLTYTSIAHHFKKSTTWASHYYKKAVEFGYIE